MLEVEASDIYIPPLRGKPQQQWFTIRSGVLTSTSSRRRGGVSGHPFIALSNGLLTRRSNAFRQRLTVFVAMY